jgi:hypothetical protein
MSASYRLVGSCATHIALVIGGWLGIEGPFSRAATFNSGGSHVVASSESFVDVYNGGTPSRPTTLTIEPGGMIPFLNVYDTSIANANGGEISHVFMNDSGRLVVGGTTIGHINLFETSMATMHAGRVDHFRAYDASHAAIYGGSAGFVSALGRGPDGSVPATIGHSTVDVLGGSVGVLRASVGGIVNVYGGTITDINPFAGGTSNIYGGTLNSMTLNDGTITNVYGRDFSLVLTGAVGNTPEYRLTGTLSDGSLINVLVLLSSNAELRLVPEPAGSGLVLFAVIFVRLHRFR